ncbi:hypothetical protein RRG08_017960 [Elysia crispata]|uniref:Uncharacterized protein n=1 Tax=Elysia crispata TaxID=231223 RepID=A0AAE1DE04_9GAST|nr:hypothetical protein RRG08_017960 [Elysia crispata]
MSEEVLQENKASREGVSDIDKVLEQNEVAAEQQEVEEETAVRTKEVDEVIDPTVGNEEPAETEDEGIKAEYKGTSESSKEDKTDQDQSTEGPSGEKTEEASGKQVPKVKNDSGSELGEEVPHKDGAELKPDVVGIKPSGTSEIFVTPKTPRASRVSYDGQNSPQLMETHEQEIMDALTNLPGKKMELESFIESIPETESVPKLVLEPLPESLSDVVPEPVPEPEPESVPEPVSESAPERVPDSMPEPVPESVPELVSGPKSQDVLSQPGQSYRARMYDEKKIMSAMQRVPPQREFMGYIFSSQTPRPHGITNYFLPMISQPGPRKHICVKGIRVPFEVLHKSMKAVPTGLLPLSAVRITWCHNPHNTVFTLTNLYAYLTRFGPIEAIYQRSPNSVMVIFCDLLSACACVKCPTLGMPWDRLVAMWWEPRMHNNGYLCRHIRMEEHNNQLAELAFKKEVSGEKLPLEG